MEKDHIQTGILTLGWAGERFRLSSAAIFHLFVPPHVLKPDPVLIRRPTGVLSFLRSSSWFAGGGKDTHSHPTLGRSLFAHRGLQIDWTRSDRMYLGSSDVCLGEQTDPFPLVMFCRGAREEDVGMLDARGKAILRCSSRARPQPGRPRPCRIGGARGMVHHPRAGAAGNPPRPLAARSPKC
jgi:hypothetical protein